MDLQTEMGVGMAPHRDNWTAILPTFDTRYVHITVAEAQALARVCTEGAEEE